MIDITTKPLSKEAYHKALALNLTTWTDYRTGEIFIQRWYWRNLSPEQKAQILTELEGLIDDYRNNH